LDVYSQGETEAKALENLIEAIQMFLRSCFERGTLDQVLKDSGFRPAGLLERSSGTERLLDVPLPFMVERKDSEGCHA
jgi:hypothetical protein